MRLSKTVALDGDRVITVQEFTVGLARNLMAEVKVLDDVDINALLTERFSELINWLGDCIQLPDGMTVNDLSITDLIKVKDGLLEVNHSFLALLGLALKPAQNPD